MVENQEHHEDDVSETQLEAAGQAAQWRRGSWLPGARGEVTVWTVRVDEGKKGDSVV
jgi:hypothetical protein